MSIPEWAAEANCLLDTWSEAQAECNARHAHAKILRDELSAAMDRAREARAAFDQFMYGCMTVRAQVYEPSAPHAGADQDNALSPTCPRPTAGSG